MPTTIAMPKLGMTMEEGTVLEWPRAIGESVEKGEVVLLIESEKAEVEIEAPISGVFRHAYIDPGETVPCGTLLGAMTASAEEPFDSEAFRDTYAAPTAPKAKPAIASRPRPAIAPAPRRRGAVPVTPAARRRARSLEIDLKSVLGSGPGGRVTVEDVEAWAERRERLVRVAEGVELDVPVQGEGDPVLLLPGFGTDVSVFAQLIPELAASNRVYGVNPRGVAASSATEEECYGVSQNATDASAVVERPAHVVGASLGAAVALELAILAPEKVRSLTLITPFVVASARLQAVCDSWCRLAAEVAPESLAKMLLPWFFSAGFLEDEVRRVRVLRGLATTVAKVPAATLERTAAGLRAWSGTRVDALSQIKIPTLVIAAAEDLLTPDAGALADGIDNAKSLVVPAAGHGVTIEAAQSVTEAVAAHVAAA